MTPRPACQTGAMDGRRLAAAGSGWAIATPHRAATEAGAEAFRGGGNAIDAALAAAVTLAVAYPHMCGAGGDLFALVQQPDGQVTAVNASGAAPMAVDPDELRRAGPAVPERGPAPITVPGAVSGWATLARLGSTNGFARAFPGAVRYAEGGVPVARSLAATLHGSAGDLARDPGMAAVFYPGGRPLAEGDLLVQPALAATLRTIADQGPETLYGGEVGRRLVEGLRPLGSPMTLGDLALHRAELAAPLSARYRDLHVSVAPPNSQGFVLLEILAAIERLEVDPDPLGPDAALIAEVFRVASADRDRHNADPRVASVPVGTLLDEGHIAAICDEARTHAAEAHPSGGPVWPSGDTIALVAADADGHAVSLIQSLYNGFGSGILEPETGIVCHNRGACFSLDPGSPNVVAGGKRPAHTLMPVLAHRDGKLAAVAGTMGGAAQPQINAQSLVRLFDLGLSPEAALDAPRWLVGGMEPDASARVVEMESRVPVEVATALQAAGFSLTILGERDEGVGHAHLIRMGPDGTFEAATDPRADGEAAAG